MTEQEITQARKNLEQLDIEQLRCGVMIQLLKIEALTKERDEYKQRMQRLMTTVLETSKERDEFRLQIDIQAGSIEAVQAANQRLSGDRDECRRQSDLQMNSAIKFCQERNAARIERDALAANHKDCVKCLGEALQDTADLAAAAKLALNALVDLSGVTMSKARYLNVIRVIEALRQAGVQ